MRFAHLSRRRFESRRRIFSENAMFKSRFSLSITVLLLAAAARAADAPPSASPVVVELFTAQGCSSCPPADHLLSKMAQEAQLQGRLIALGFHVDYWNEGGWTDPFSAGTWTDRQNAYMKALAPGRVYTPQTIVDGQGVCVGSDEAKLRSLIAEAAARPHGTVTLGLKRDGGKVAVDIDAAPPQGFAGNLDVNLAVTEDGLDTAVKAGENAHHDLHDDFVVRRLERVFKLKGAGHHDSTTVRLEHGWKSENLKVAVFLQDPETHAIVGAASAAVPQ
jgi:hypothetical protein